MLGIMTNEKKLELAYEYYSNNKLEKAEKLIEELEKEVSELELSFLKCKILIGLDKNKEAKETLELIRSDLFHNIGYMALFDEERSQERVVETLGLLEIANSSLTEVYLNECEYEAALGIVKETLKLLELDEVDPFYLYLAAQTFFANAQYEKSIEMLTEIKIRGFENDTSLLLNSLGMVGNFYSLQDTNNVIIILDDILDFLKAKGAQPIGDTFPMFFLLANVMASLNLKDYILKFIGSSLLKNKVLKYYFETTLSLMNGDEEEAKINVKMYKESIEKYCESSNSLSFKDFWSYDDWKDVKFSKEDFFKRFFYPQNLSSEVIHQFYESVYGKVKFE